MPLEEWATDSRLRQSGSWYLPAEPNGQIRQDLLPLMARPVGSCFATPWFSSRGSSSTIRAELFWRSSTAAVRVSYWVETSREASEWAARRLPDGVRVMTKRLRGQIASIAIIASAVVGCVAGGGTASGQSQEVALGVINTTTLTIRVIVNGHEIETLQPGMSDTTIRLGVLPTPPWVVEARTTTGRVLVSLNVDSVPTLPPGNAGGASGKQAAAQLSCGQVYVWSGSVEPPFPVPEHGTVGDCTP
jgi:hypothetical protein